MSKLTGEINKSLKYFGFQIKKYESPNYGWIVNNNIKTIIDIGANIGQFANIYGTAKSLKDIKIYSFEPIKHCYDSLVLNTKNLNIECYNIGFGDKKEEAIIKIYNHDPSSSLLEMAKLHEELYPHSKGYREEKVDIDTLDNFFNNKSFDDNLLIKIDVQGFELNVINGGLNTLKRAKVILIEMSYQELYLGQALFDEIYIILRNLGFRFKGNIVQTFSPLDGSIVFSDSIFIKE